MNEEYRFRPYVGPKYGTEESVLRRRLLVLGASHYGVDADNHDGNLTQVVISHYLDPNRRVNRKNKNYTWKPTHTRFYKAIIGDRCVGIDAVVKSVVFYNYLQTFEGVGPEDKHPEKFFQKEIKEKNEKCFERLLRELKPEVIIVWGANVRNAFPWELFSAESRQNCDKQFPSICHCTLKGECSMDIDVCFSAHPSSPKWFYMQEPRALFSALKLFDA